MIHLPSTLDFIHHGSFWNIKLGDIFTPCSCAFPLLLPLCCDDGHYDKSETLVVQGHKKYTQTHCIFMGKSLEEREQNLRWALLPRALRK